MMGNTTTDEDVRMSEDVRQMRDKVRKRFRGRLANVAMREALLSDSRMQTYTDVMSEDGWIPVFIPLISLAEVRTLRIMKQYSRTLQKAYCLALFWLLQCFANQSIGTFW